jgi:predicted nucleotidyltransferase
MTPTSNLTLASAADFSGDVPDLQLVVLFGSAARGRARSTSDLDVAVRCDGAADLDARLMALAPRLKSERVDLSISGTRVRCSPSRSRDPGVLDTRTP